MSKRDIEYEYLFVNDSVEVSKIIRKSKRKEVYHFANGDVNLIAKTDSIYVDNEHQKNPNIKLYNFASGKDVNPDEVYAFIISRDNKYEEVHLRLNDRTLKHVNTFFKDKLKA
jgi:RecJ-like exonuclease